MEIKISFAGDLMCKLPQLQASATGNTYDFDAVFGKIGNVFKNSDYVVGNMETPLAGPELGYTKTATNFNAPIEFAQPKKPVSISLPLPTTIVLTEELKVFSTLSTI